MDSLRAWRDLLQERREEGGGKQKKTPKPTFDPWQHEA